MGKIFSIKHDRCLGMHVPWGTEINKARDPFINLITLGKLSHSDSPEVRDAVVKNLAKRLAFDFSEAKLDRISSATDLILNNFDLKVVALALKNMPEGEVGNKGIIRFLLDEITSAELADIAAYSKNYNVCEVIALLPKTPRPTLLGLAQAGLSMRVAMTAYMHNLLPTLSPDELSFLAESRHVEVRSKVALDERTPRETLIDLALNDCYMDKDHEVQGSSATAITTLEKKDLPLEKTSFSVAELVRLSEGKDPGGLAVVATNVATPKEILLRMVNLTAQQVLEQCKICRYAPEIAKKVAEGIALKAYTTLLLTNQLSDKEIIGLLRKEFLHPPIPMLFPAHRNIAFGLMLLRDDQFALEIYQALQATLRPDELAVLARAKSEKIRLLVAKDERTPKATIDELAAYYKKRQPLYEMLTKILEQAKTLPGVNTPEQLKEMTILELRELGLELYYEDALLRPELIKLLRPDKSLEGEQGLVYDPSLFQELLSKKIFAKRAGRIAAYVREPLTKKENEHEQIFFLRSELYEACANLIDYASTRIQGRLRQEFMKGKEIAQLPTCYIEGKGDDFLVFEYNKEKLTMVPLLSKKTYDSFQLYQTIVPRALAFECFEQASSLFGGGTTFSLRAMPMEYYKPNSFTAKLVENLRKEQAGIILDFCSLALDIFPDMTEDETQTLFSGRFTLLEVKKFVASVGAEDLTSAIGQEFMKKISGYDSLRDY